MPPASGSRPILLKAWMKRADSTANTTSHARTRLAPAPAATPFITHTTGAGSARSRMMSGLYSFSRFSLRSRREPSSAGLRSPRSWPAQKPRPAPVRITPRNPACASSVSSARASSACMTAVKLFRRSGRLSVMTPTPCSSVNVISL